MAEDIKCPVCGGRTTIRIAKKGPGAGKQFHVCDRYPECKGKMEFQIESEVAESDVLGEQREESIQAAKSRIEKYRAEQETILRNEKAEFEKFMAEQEKILENEKSDFEKYKLEQETSLSNVRVEFERHKAEQEALISNEKLEFEKYRAGQETILKDEKAEVEKYRSEQEASIAKEKAEIDKYRTGQETILKDEKAEFERFRAEQEESIGSEKTEIEKYRRGQENILKEEKTEFGKFMAEQEKIIESEKAGFERYRAEQEAIIESARAEHKRAQALSEQILQRERNLLQEGDSKVSKEKSGMQIGAAALRAEVEKKLELRLQEVKNREADFDRLVKEKTRGFPWLANAYSDYLRLCDWKLTRLLETRSHTEAQTAEEIKKQIAQERRDAEKAAMIGKSLLEYCRFLAPWLDDYVGIPSEELDRIINNMHSSWDKKELDLDEEVKQQIGARTWATLMPIDSLQKKLDWYWDRPNKTFWQLSRDYENYIGYLYERNGWQVQFHGRAGFEGIGRSLVCKKSDCVEIIQCKNWSSDKMIHERDVYYLFGAAVEYYMKHFEKAGGLHIESLLDHMKKKDLSAKLIITTGVSPAAERSGRLLQVAVEQTPFLRYPSVRCTVCARSGEHKYYLPFDEHYEALISEDESLERYVVTVAEAERLGYRHA